MCSTVVSAQLFPRSCGFYFIGRSRRTDWPIKCPEPTLESGDTKTLALVADMSLDESFLTAVDLNSFSEPSRLRDDTRCLSFNFELSVQDRYRVQTSCTLYIVRPAASLTSTPLRHVNFFESVSYVSLLRYLLSVNSFSVSCDHPDGQRDIVTS